MKIKQVINWKVFAILFTGSIIGILGVIPYSLTLQEDILKQVPLPLPFLITISILQSIVLFFIVLFLGLFFAKKIGLGTPILERLIQKKAVLPEIKSTSIISISLGLLAGSLIIIGDYLFISLSSFDLTNILQTPPPWQGFLVSFYGGINEEILLRLFFMSLLIWIFTKITKTNQKFPNKIIIWIAIIVTSVLFGLAHLPIIASLTKITPILIARAILLNGIGGLIFGWLYWRKGLEASILSHFTADFILHVLIPFVLL